MENKLQQLHVRLCSCAVFRGVLQDPVFGFFAAYCRAQDKAEKMQQYATFVSRIYEKGGCLTELVKELVFQDENTYIKSVAQGVAVSEKVKSSAVRELAIFADFGGVTSAVFAQDMGVDEAEISAFDAFNADMGALYGERLQNLSKFGYGIFSSNCMFRFSDTKQIEPIVSADKTAFSQFIGYEREREKVTANTRAFLEGRPAANTLLCGDAGTGKSSTVKAIANNFFDDGLRLIELRKDQLRFLPLVMAKINGNPLKFIIFIDDLSFNQNNDDFSMLKAALEGSASATADNAVIYATSNRRHIVKEAFSDREGDDVHVNDTLQETLSLSDRFGLTVLFSRPNKTLYLNIVKELAKRYGVEMDEKTLELKAEEFALKKGSRSARGAQQFVDSLR